MQCWPCQQVSAQAAITSSISVTARGSQEDVEGSWCAQIPANPFAKHQQAIWGSTTSRPAFRTPVPERLFRVEADAAMDSGSEDWPSSLSLDMQHFLERSLKQFCSEWDQHLLQSRDPSSAGTGLRNQKFLNEHIPRRERKSSVVFQEIGNEQEMYSFLIYCLFLPSNALPCCISLLCHSLP